MLLCMLALALQSVDASSIQTLSATGAGSSLQPSISADGLWIVFASTAADLVTDDTDGSSDIFLRSRQFRATTRISDNGPFACASPAMSGDGRWIAYWRSDCDEASARVGKVSWRLALHDRVTGETAELDGVAKTWNLSYAPKPASLTHDGARIVYAAITEDVEMALLFDRVSGSTDCVSLSTACLRSDRAVTDVRISAGGRFVVFCTDALNLAEPKSSSMNSIFEFMRERQHVFVRDLELGSTQYASDRALQTLGYAGYDSPLVSDDGRFVAYNHHDSRKMGCRHVGFISDLTTNHAGRLIERCDEEWFQGALEIHWMSRDGGRALVSSAITGLDPLAPATEPGELYFFDGRNTSFQRIRHPALLAAAQISRPALAVSDDGQTIAIVTADASLIAQDRNDAVDIFAVSLADGSLELISAAFRR